MKVIIAPQYEKGALLLKSAALGSKTADHFIMPFRELCYLVSNIQYLLITVCWVTL